MKKVKLLIAAIVASISLCGDACWYVKSNYTDYINSINGIQVISITKVGSVNRYTITNNNVVDFPLTVSMKLVSDEEVDLNTNEGSHIGELLRGKLQYRVLPNGSWVTVQEYNTPTGTISKDSPPKNYFGQNNIWPKNIKAGTAIMIRLYVTDGIWQSGQLANKCADKLTNVSTPYGTVKTLPNSFTYMMNGSDILNYNLGGNWYPHLAVTVIYSGKDRPMK